MLTLVASALLCCPPVAQVGGYGYSGYAQPSYGYAQTYAPAYQQQAYQAPYAAFQANPAAFAESVAAYVRKQDAARAAEQRQLDLLNKVDRLGVIVEKLAVQPPPQPFQAPQPSPQYQATPQYQAPPVPSKQAPEQPFAAPLPPLVQPPVPSKSSYGPAGGPTLPPTTPATPDFNGFQSWTPTTAPVSLVQALTRCAECHTGPGSKRGVVIFDSPGVLANLGLDQRLEMLDAVRSGRMPPRSAPDPVVAAAILQSIQADVSSLASNNVGRARR
jgi:hypothetical protein